MKDYARQISLLQLANNARWTYSAIHLIVKTKRADRILESFNQRSAVTVILASTQPGTIQDQAAFKAGVNLSSNA